MAELRRKMKFTRWSGSGALYGTRPQVAEARRLLRGGVERGREQTPIAGRPHIEYGGEIYRALPHGYGPRSYTHGPLVKPVYGLLRGVPTEQSLGRAYWRKSMPVPADPDPDRDGCGLIWTAPVAPTEGEYAARLAGIVERRLLAHGFEPMISVTLLTERSIACVVSITYDSEKRGEGEKAMESYLALQAELEGEGYYSYWLAMPALPSPAADSAYRRLLKNIRTALDPNQVLAPGRYVPRV